MNKFQKTICVFLCLCMILGFAVYYPSGFRGGDAAGSSRLARMLPVMAYCKAEEERETNTEDQATYEAILEANRRYLAEQVTGENARQKEQEEVREQKKKKKKAKAEAKKEAQAEEKARKQEEEALSREKVVEISRSQLEDSDYLLSQFYIVDPNTAATGEQINAAALLDNDMALAADAASPQILIYHSHSQETYADSVPGNVEDTVVGVGNVLEKLLTENYGYGVIHVTDTFDVVNGEIDRNSAYDYARARAEQVLAENPSIEVVIDLHRDGVPEDRHLVTQVDGKPTAQIMFFNGLSYSAMNGPVEYLPNPNITGNLAFSFQMQLEADQYFPEFSRNIYLSSLRYNLHLKPRSTLVEVGAQNNTVEEAKNAMEPLAFILNKVLKGENE